jgi:carbonic anhydrase
LYDPSIQVNYGPDSTLDIGGAVYPLVQFHYHAPSKQTLNGPHTAMELHLMHKDASGHVAIVGVMMVQGARTYYLFINKTDRKRWLRVEKRWILWHSCVSPTQE